MDLGVSQIGFLIYSAAIIGYLGYFFYNFGYYGVAYRPRGNLRRLLDYSAVGFLLILFASFIFINALANGTITIPEALSSISVSEETQSIFLLYGYLFVNLVMFVIFLTFGALVLGILSKNSLAQGLIIETKDNNSPLDIREIYDENEDFFFFFDNNGNWGAIKKSDISKITSSRKASILDQNIRKFKEGHPKLFKIFLIVGLLVYVFIILYGLLTK